MSRKVVVYHDYWGCETGCCGHVIEVDDGLEEFTFDHPYRTDFREFAEKLVREELGEDHVADLDWDNCLVVDD